MAQVMIGRAVVTSRTARQRVAQEAKLRAANFAAEAAKARVKPAIKKDVATSTPTVLFARVAVEVVPLKQRNIEAPIVPCTKPERRKFAYLPRITTAALHAMTATASDGPHREMASGNSRGRMF